MNITESRNTRNQATQEILDTTYLAFEKGRSVRLYSTTREGVYMDISVDDNEKPFAEMKEGTAYFSDYDQYEIFVHHNVQNLGYSL